MVLGAATAGTVKADLMVVESKSRLAEIVGVLALATDLASGLQLEHGFRRTLIVLWLGERAGLGGQQMQDAYYVSMLGSAGCVLDTAAVACFLDDDIAFRGGMFSLDMANPLVAVRYLGRNVAGDQPAMRRAARVIGLSRQAAVFRDVALSVGGLFDLGPSVREALGQCDEHWNGKAGVLGLKGEQISIHARLFRLAQDIDVFQRESGMPAAVEVMRRRAGIYYDPALVALLLADSEELSSRLEVASPWDAVLAAEPIPLRMLSANEFDVVAHQVANFIDMRSAYTVGHSPAVAMFAEAAARGLGLSTAEARMLRAAGLLHDLGRAGVPVALWDKAGPLSPEERERVERHPALTELLLARSSSLSQLGALAALHHERLDGTGYRGVTAASLSVAARVLAVADMYQSKLEPRAYRRALTAEQAAAAVRDQVKGGRLDGEIVKAVLDAAGHPEPEVFATLPAGLTRREVEVLRLVVRGMSNREIAEALTLSQKTVSHHLESIYAKIDVSTRVGATLFAIEHALTTNLTSPIRR
jgi:HD-GYP domain-containing protein (c-di-GMP phosphodiesterase class II)